MKVTVHSVSDQLGSDKYFGIGDEGYDKAMEFLNHNQDEIIKFVWDMTDDQFKTLMAPQDDDTPEDLRDYCGAVFFGNFKLEFIRTEDDPYCNCYQYGANDNFGGCGPYAYLSDGTPYDERFQIDEAICITKRRTFEHFAENIEKQVISVLNQAPKYIEEAIKPTDPARWYPDGQSDYTITITRVA